MSVAQVSTKHVYPRSKSKEQEQEQEQEPTNLDQTSIPYLFKTFVDDFLQLSANRGEDSNFAINSQSRERLSIGAEGEIRSPSLILKNGNKMTKL